MSAILNDILEVFASVGEWITTAFNSLMPVFYTTPVDGVGGGLTVIGTLAICGLAFSVALLIFNVIKSFLRFR